MNKNAKRILSLMLGLLLAVSVFPMTATAALSNSEGGQLLIKMSSLDPSTVLVNRIGASIDTAANSKAKLDTNDSTKILAADTSTTGSVGVKTNLPLNADTKYTIEYYAKMTDYDKTMGMSFGFMYNTDSSNKCISVCVGGNNNKVYTYSNGATNRWFLNDSTSDRWSKEISYNPWTSKADQDGYVRYVFTFDGKYIRLSIGGVDTGYKWDITKAGGSGAATLDSLVSNTGGQLYISAGYNDKLSSDGSALTVGDCVMQIKDISIYSGIVDPDDVPDDVPDSEFVIFKGIDGTIIQSTEIENGSLTLQSFPDVTAESQLVWINEETGAIAETPMTVTSSTTFRAYDIGKNESKTLGVQYGAVSGGKQDIRFIGGIFATSGSGVGFEIVAKYKEGDSLKTETYKGAGNKVYTSITATENGTLKNATAKELGAYYVYGIVIENVPTDIGQIDFTVKSYKEVGKNKIRIYGEPVTVSFKDGALDSTLAPLS
ncbi:MAG: hypothetical protein IJZ83_00985 [Clostridia bacterium]|nr:hypothetical protein [Clostridia bacterium]